MWYPAYHQQTLFDKTTGQFLEKKIYTIDSNTFDFNNEIATDEFAIDIPVGAKVVDNRDNKNESYMADEPGTLTLVSGSFDLKKQTWLRKIGDIPQHHTRVGFVRILLILSGVVLIFLSLFFKFKKRTKNLLPLFLFSFMCGCNSPTITSDSITVSPSVLDFGKVRATDPPVQTQFTLCNNGTKPVTILEITSGCGCTNFH
ncbi:hypothetical protein FACS18942_00470 [Planctomycetales bacterium]|nr:hypothetical protein FACS18942_00470 [Planctomycetales bacterium]